jgi:PAS domain S-box-containing protein
VHIRATGVALDITERKRAQENSARLAAIVSSSSDAIVSVSAEDLRIITWNRGAETLFGYSEREALGAPASLLVAPLHLTEAETETGVFHRTIAEGQLKIDAVRRRKDGTLVAVSVSAARMVDAEGRVLGVSAIFRDITDRKRWEEHQRLLIGELNHRVKNTLATVQSIASQTLRNAPTTQEARDALESRLMALSRAHNVLTRENWESASLMEIVDQAVEPYTGGRENRLRREGPAVRLQPRTALALSMALQELATNAVKYGSLSNETGEVRVSWRVHGQEPRLHLRWVEVGGPRVAPPQRRGFGTRLIERSLAQDLNGEVRIQFAPLGLVCTVDAPLSLEPNLLPGSELYLDPLVYG